MSVKSFSDRLKDGDTIILAEGYIMHFEQRCFLQAGPFVPIVVLEHPEIVKQSYIEFADAGSDIVLAFTYYGHEEKMKLIGYENKLEELNRKALKLAKEVADDKGLLMAGNLSNTTLDVKVPAQLKEMEKIFDDQCKWAKEEGADLIVVETIIFAKEAELALKAAQKVGLPTIIMLAPKNNGMLDDGVSHVDCLKSLAAQGADVVGYNCYHGPEAHIELGVELKKHVNIPIAVNPVMYRTKLSSHTILTEPNPLTGKPCFYEDLDMLRCCRSELKKYAEDCKKHKFQVVGLCCGNQPYYTRTVAETLGRTPKASRYSPNMDLHFFHGKKDDPRLKLAAQLRDTNVY